MNFDRQFTPVRKLDVLRVLGTGEKIAVGTLAQDREHTYFSYQSDYLREFGNLSPFGLKADTTLQIAPKQPFDGLHGVFADSLPDGWGLLLQDRYFRKLGILPHQITQLDRLAFVGSRGIGALQFEPNYDLEDSDNKLIKISELGLQAQAVFDGQTDDVLQALIVAGSSGGARPKAQVFTSLTDDILKTCRTIPQQGDNAWIVKFTSKNLTLGHEEGLCEAVYLTMAQQCGLNPVEWKLLAAPKESGSSQWLAVKRFDWINTCNHTGRYHVHSVAGLLNADFRMPSLDYEDIIKVSKLLCQSPEIGKLQFARAMFNLFSMNQDDHSKNWAFMQDDKGIWTPTPHYDITFSPSPYGEHATAFGGFGKKPPINMIQKLANRAGFDDWQQAKIVIEKIIDSVAQFKQIAQQFAINPTTIKLIEKQLNMVRKANQGLLST